MNGYNEAPTVSEKCGKPTQKLLGNIKRYLGQYYIRLLHTVIPTMYGWPAKVVTPCFTEGYGDLSAFEAYINTSNFISRKYFRLYQQSSIMDKYVLMRYLNYRFPQRNYS